MLLLYIYRGESTHFCAWIGPNDMIFADCVLGSASCGE